MRRSVTTPFFSTAGFSMFDSWQFASGGGVNNDIWTTGKTITRPALLGGPTPEQEWQLVSVSVEANLVWVWDNSNVLTSYGKLGAILCGLSMDEVLSTQSGNQYQVFLTPIPMDTTLLTTLWDPGQHPMPPTVISQAGGAVPAQSPTNSLTVSATVMPTTPLKLLPGVNPVVGIWMLPSLLGLLTLSGTGGVPNGIGLDIGGAARFTINYDDGL